VEFIFKIPIAPGGTEPVASPLLSVCPYAEDTSPSEESTAAFLHFKLNFSLVPPLLPPGKLRRGFGRVVPPGRSGEGARDTRAPTPPTPRPIQEVTLTSSAGFGRAAGHQAVPPGRLWEAPFPRKKKPAQNFLIFFFYDFFSCRDYFYSEPPLGMRSWPRVGGFGEIVLL